MRAYDLQKALHPAEVWTRCPKGQGQCQ